MEAVVGGNPRESNECLFNSTSVPGTPLITELIVVADKTTVRKLSDNKDCVGKIKSVIKEETINRVLSPLSGKRSPGAPAGVWMGIRDTDVLPPTICAGS